MTIQAGPELDRLIVEKVMGWSKALAKNGKDIGLFHNGTENVWGFTFRPTVNLPQAFEVIARLMFLGFFLTIKPRSEVAHCSVEDYDGLELHHAKANTVPMAICLCAIAVVEGTP